MMKIIKNIAAIFFLSMTLIFTGVAHPIDGGGDFDQRRERPRERPKEGEKKGGKSDRGKPRDEKKGDRKRRN
jgi:hypothetical protein